MYSYALCPISLYQGKLTKWKVGGRRNICWRKFATGTRRDRTEPRYERTILKRILLHSIDGEFNYNFLINYRNATLIDSDVAALRFIYLITTRIYPKF